MTKYLKGTDTFLTKIPAVNTLNYSFWEEEYPCNFIYLIVVQLMNIQITIASFINSYDQFYQMKYIFHIEFILCMYS